MPPPPVEDPKDPPASSSSSEPSTSTSSWGSLAQQEEAEAIAAAERAAKTHAKPFSTPPGFEAPSLGEQFFYAARRHPYARLGYAVAFLMGAGVWWFVSGSSDGEKKKQK